jgi:hypothetical protein
MWSLAQTLERIRPVLPAAVVSDRVLERVAIVARRLPAPLTRRFYLERWLGDAPARVDWIVRIDARTRSVLAEGAPGPWDEVMLADPAWQRLVSFARAWSEPGSALERGVEALWLEFDLPAGPAESSLPVPRVFVDFTREAREQSSIDARLDLMRHALQPLATGGLDGAAVERLRACLSSLPPGASIPYLGTTLRGGEHALRVCAQGLGPGLLQYLHALDWPGDGDDLAASVLVPLAAAKGDAVNSASVVHLDMTAGVKARLGLEYAFARPCQERGFVQEAPFLDHLVARGWCSGAVRDGLLRWPGTSVELMPHEIWLSRLSRRLNHVKVTYATGEPVGLKAYLCFQNELVASGTLLGTRPWLPAAHPSAIG